jgi:hypothetical protein
MAEDAAGLQLYPKAISDPEANRQAREEIDQVADQLNVDRQAPDGNGYGEFPVTTQELARALDVVTARWRDAGSYYIRPTA